MKKRLIAMLLVLGMVCAFPVNALAASDEAVGAAQSLYDLGLFRGMGDNADGTPNFDLDRAPTRQEAITMLVRLLGKEEEAKAGTWETPFTDVDDWAKPYVGYAYTNRLVAGLSDTIFGGNDSVGATQYLTFILRALGYSSSTDFQWDRAWELSDQIKLTDGHYNAETATFTRGDVAIISLKALSTPMRDSSTTLDGTPVKSIEELLQGMWMGLEDTGNYECAEYYCFNGTAYSCAYMFIDENKSTGNITVHGSGYEEGTFSIDGDALKLDRTTSYFYAEDGSNTIVSDEKQLSEYKLTTDFTSGHFYMNDWMYRKEHDDFQLEPVYSATKERILSHISLVSDSELTATEKATIVEKMKDALSQSATAARSTQGALAYDGQLLVGSIAGMSYSKRLAAQQGMQKAELAVMATCVLIHMDIVEVRKILESKVGTESLVSDLQELESFYATIFNMTANSDHDQLMTMSNTLSAATDLLTKISDIIIETYLE